MPLMKCRHFALGEIYRGGDERRVDGARATRIGEIAAYRRSGLDNAV